MRLGFYRFRNNELERRDLVDRAWKPGLRGR
jgi:hypothetical protein